MNNALSRSLYDNGLLFSAKRCFLGLMGQCLNNSRQQVGTSGRDLWAPLFLPRKLFCASKIYVVVRSLNAIQEIYVSNLLPLRILELDHMKVSTTKVAFSVLYFGHGAFAQFVDDMTYRGLTIDFMCSN